MLSIGVIGAGGVFRNAHAVAYEKRNDVEIACIADPIERNRAEAGARLGCTALYEDYRHALDRADVQAVDICLPHFLHREVVLAALDAGKNVLLEKPIALNLEQADEMIGAAQRTGKAFYVLLNQRFYPAHDKLEQIIESGEYGKPYLALAHVIGDEFARMNIRDNWKGTWDLAGGGALADTGTHMVDLMLWWFGRPKTVSCQWGRFVVEADNKADDNVVVTFGYESMLAEIVISYSARSDTWSERKQIYFKNASVHISPGSDQPMLLGQNKEPPTPVSVPGMEPWWAKSVAAGLDHFVDCLMGKAQPKYGAEAARDTLEMILLAYRAAAEGRTLTVPARE